MLHPAALPLPLLGRLLPAGFPSPADDYLAGEIDLGAYLIERPASTFLMRVSGESMKNASILDGDLVVVDRSVTPQSGHVVVGVVEGEMTLKRFRRKGASIALEAANPAYETRIFGPDQVEVQGKLVGLIRRYH